MADPALPAYPWTQRAIDRAVLWSFSRLLSAALRLVSRFRRGSAGASAAC